MSYLLRLWPANPHINYPWERRRLAGYVLRINETFASKLHSMSRLLSFSFIHARKKRRFRGKSYTVLAVSADILSSMPALPVWGLISLHVFCMIEIQDTDE